MVLCASSTCCGVDGICLMHCIYLASIEALFTLSGTHFLGYTYSVFLHPYLFLSAPMMDVEDLSPHLLSMLCAVLSLMLLMYTRYHMTQQQPEQPQMNYAFTACTEVGCRTPTVLLFLAQVPPGAAVTPTIIRTLDIPSGEVENW